MAAETQAALTQGRTEKRQETKASPMPGHRTKVMQTGRMGRPTGRGGQKSIALLLEDQRFMELKDNHSLIIPSSISDHFWQLSRDLDFSVLSRPY